jgi:dihydrofolate synthase/folylpolyglutamate synthase
MTYRETLAYLSGLNPLGIRLGLDSIRALLARLGDPQKAYPAILIAGTNGKGSVAAMTASILTAAGFRTGLYTSPDLLDLRERIRIDGRMIGQREMALCAARIRGEVRGEISYFEALTAMAFCNFQRRKVDIAVLEVGLGGRLDATNVTLPLVSVITNIGLDHQAYLGGTLAAIAREKGGIIKPGGICLTAVQQRRIQEVLEAICKERGARLCRLGKEIRIRVRRDGIFSYQGPDRRWEGLRCPFPGRHQFANAALALGVVERIGKAGFRIDDRAVTEGLAKSRWEGRLEVLRSRPTLLVDGAHNPAGAAALAKALRDEFPHRRLWLIFGVLEDKNHRAMAQRLFPLAEAVFLTRPPSERARPPEALQLELGDEHPRIEVVEKPGEALARALGAAAEEDLVCAAGSLYLVAEIKRIIRDGGLLYEYRREGVR